MKSQNKVNVRIVFECVLLLMMFCCIGLLQFLEHFVGVAPPYLSR